MVSTENVHIEVSTTITPTESSLTEGGYITESAVSSSESITEPVEVLPEAVISVKTVDTENNAEELNQDVADIVEEIESSSVEAEKDAPSPLIIDDRVETTVSSSSSDVALPVTTTEPEPADTPTSQPVVAADPSSLEAQQLAAVAAAAAVDAVFDEYMGRSLDAADGDYATSSESTLAETPLQNSVASSAFNSTRNSHDNLVMLGGPTAGDAATRSRQSSVDFGHHSMTAHLTSPSAHRVTTGSISNSNSNSNSSLSTTHHGEHEKAPGSPAKQSTPPAAKHAPTTSPKATHSTFSNSTSSSSSTPSLSVTVPRAPLSSTPVKASQKHSTSSSDLTSPISHNTATLSSAITPTNASASTGGGGGVSPKTPWFPGKYILQR
eukprot:gene37887-46753_t